MNRLALARLLLASAIGCGGATVHDASGDASAGARDGGEGGLLDAEREAAIDGATVDAAPTCMAPCAGCCQGAVCAVGDQDFACGGGGGNCASCVERGMTCRGGVCQ